MPEIHADDTIDAETATEGDDISDQHVALPLDKPDSTRSPRASCAGLSNPSGEDPFTDDGYVSDGMVASFYFRTIVRSLILRAAKRSTIATRLRKVLRLQPSEEPDPGIEQIINSCEYVSFRYVHPADGPILVDDYDPGYGKVAAIEDLDADFLVYRKFGWLHNYALLYLQDELVQQQDEMESFDKWESRNGDPTKLVSRRKDHAFRESRRKELVAKLQVKLAQYGEPSMQQSRHNFQY